MPWTIRPEDEAAPAPGSKRRRRENEKSENNAPSFRSIEPLAQLKAQKSRNDMLVAPLGHLHMWPGPRHSPVGCQNGG